MQEEHPVLTGPQIVLFMIFVYENIVLVVLLEKNFYWTWKILKDNHYKNIDWSVKTECSSCRMC